MKELHEVRTKSAINTPFFLLIISILCSFYFIDIGFALKPFMILLVVLLAISINTFAIHKLKLYEILLLVYFGYYCITGMFSKYPEYSFRMILGVFLVIFCYFVMRYVMSVASIKGIERGIALGGIIYNAISLLLYFTGLFVLGFVTAGNKIIEYGVEIDRNTPRLIGMTPDPNIFCFYNFIFFFYYLTHLNTKWSKLGIFLTTTTMLLSLSRGAMLAIAIALLFMFMVTSFGKKVKLLIFIPLSVLVLNFSLKLTVGIDIFNMITSRFSDIEGGSGRSGIWGKGFYFFQDHPFFGIGIFNFRPYSEAEFGHAAYMHNTFLEALVEGGIVGFILYLMVFITFIITYLYNRFYIKDNGYLFFSFIAVSIMMTTYSFMVNEIFFLLLALMWRYLFEIKNPNHREDKNSQPKKKKRYKLTW